MKTVMLLHVHLDNRTSIDRMDEIRRAMRETFPEVERVEFHASKWVEG